MEEIMQSNLFFIIPLTLAYGSVCALWFLLASKSSRWPITPIKSSTKPWLDFGLSLAAAISILAIGQLYSHGLLIPKTESKTLNGLIWMLNNVIIFSPIFFTLFFRKQGLETVFLSGKKLPIKIGFGLLASAVGIIVFVGLRGEWGRLGSIIMSSFTFDALVNFPAVFFENVAIAFLFVRIKWLIGMRWAILIPSLLFAFSHVPSSLAEGDPLGHILIFFALTSGLTLFILYTTYRSRDIIWLGVVHYLMDVAIEVF